MGVSESIKPCFLWFTTQLWLPAYNFIPLLTAVANIKLFVSLVIAETAVMVPVSQFWMGFQVCSLWLLDSGPFFPISLQELGRIGSHLLLHAVILKDFRMLKGFICDFISFTFVFEATWVQQLAVFEGLLSLLLSTLFLTHLSKCSRTIRSSRLTILI